MKNKVIFGVFLAFLLAPVLTFPLVRGHIDSANNENRQFASAPKLSLSTITSFPQEFDAYFSDHLPYKNQLVMLNSLKNEKIGAGTTTLDYLTKTLVIRGKDNWMFYNANGTKEESLNDYLCNNLYTPQELEEIAEGYVLLQDELKKYGGTLVVMYAANKEQVYPEFMPATIVPLDTYSRTQQLVDYLGANTSVPLIYTKDALLREKENHQVFYKYDTHWNSLGGFVGAQLLNEYFHGEYVSLNEVQCVAKKHNQSGDLAKLLSMNKIYKDDTEWEIEGYKSHVNVELLDKSDDIVFKSDADDQRRVLVVMDSFGEYLMDMAKDYGQVRFTRHASNIKYYCEADQPDLVVVEIVERRKEAQESWCRGMYEKLIIDME